MPHIHWVARQNKLEIPRDKDEVKQCEIRESDGRAHDPDTMVAPLTPKPTRKAETLARAPPTIASRREEDAALKEVAMLPRYRCLHSPPNEVKTRKKEKKSSLGVQRKKGGRNVSKMSHHLRPKESEVLRRGRNEFLETLWLSARRSRRRVENQEETIEIQPARRKDSLDSDCTEDNLPFQDEQACRAFNSADATQNHSPIPKATSYVDFMVVLSMDRSAAGDDFVKST